MNYIFSSLNSKHQIKVKLTSYDKIRYILRSKIIYVLVYKYLDDYQSSYYTQNQCYSLTSYKKRPYNVFFAYLMNSHSHCSSCSYSCFDFYFWFLNFKILICIKIYTLINIIINRRIVIILLYDNFRLIGIIHNHTCCLHFPK